MESHTRAARRAHWRRLLESHARSGLSLRAFAVREGVSPHTLAYWKYKRSEPSPSRPSQLIPVTLIDSIATSSAPITLELEGARLTLPSNFDGDSLVRALEILRRPC